MLMHYVCPFFLLHQAFELWKADKDEVLVEKYRKEKKKQRHNEESKVYEQEDKEKAARSAYKSW